MGDSLSLIFGLPNLRFRTLPSPPPDADPDQNVQLPQYQGQAITLLTDTSEEYAIGLLPKLDSFIQQETATASRLLGVQVKLQPTRIIIFESQKDYKNYARKNAPGLVNNGGYYDGVRRTVVTHRFNNSMQLYFHELVHAMMGELFSDKTFSRYNRHHWPIWFDEGISEYLGSFEVAGQSITIPSLNKGKLAYLANAITNNTFIDLQTLLQTPNERYSSDMMNVYYAESWGLIHFLANSPSHRLQLPEFFSRIRQGEDGVVAFKRSFGNDIAALDVSWRTYIAKIAQPATGWVPLFNGISIDDWTVHEGGQWKVSNGTIAASAGGDQQNDYLIKSEVPMKNFAYEMDLQLTKGTTGLVLGNNSNDEYPYYYLIDVARDAISLRRVDSAHRISLMDRAPTDIPQGEWVRLRAQVINHTLTLSIGGKEELTAQVDRKQFSLFGLYLDKAQAQFRNIQVRNEDPESAR